jgi:hypothetical protein
MIQAILTDHNMITSDILLQSKQHQGNEAKQQIGGTDPEIRLSEYTNQHIAPKCQSQ